MFVFALAVPAQSSHLDRIDESTLTIYPEDADFDMNALSEQDKMLFCQFI
jgi:hypothetical protein